MEKEAINFDEIIGEVEEHVKKSTSQAVSTVLEKYFQDDTQESSPKKEIITTTEEIEGYAIVKTLLRYVVHMDRVHYRDNTAYFAVLLDDNNRKTIVRLRCGRVLQLGLMNGGNEEKVDLDTINDIVNYKDMLVERVNELI